MPMKVEEKKEMAAEKQDKNMVKPRKRKEVFIYGNYRNYYGYRLHHTMEDDPRLKVFKREWFDNKDCLDIGCNQGLVTITIAKMFSCRSMVGIDIDKGLIEDARCNLRNTVRKQKSHGTLAKCSYAEGLNCGDLSEQKFPLVLNEETLYPQCCPSFPREQDLLQRVSFHCENFVENIHRSSEKFHTILCLSVTKWIHLNWGDDGLLTLFSKIWRLLKPGGVLLLEPQPWTSYKRYRLLSESTRTNYNNIHLHPDQFRDILLDKVGFKSADTITDNLSGTVAGFDRQIIAFQK
ncbi:probable RNA methyltransferase At5g51130 isoform X2 [Phalaenopsis equestris]|nr:probable RNA methyltransferase At5g51130 isoform X2 [Phalaenopsis equestris]